MGNRCVITDGKVGIYRHWNGGYDSITGFLCYCDAIGISGPSEQSLQAWGALVSVMAHWEDGSFMERREEYGSVSNRDFPEIFAIEGDLEENIRKYDPGDNGVYVIGGPHWEITKRMFRHPDEREGAVKPELEQCIYGLENFMNGIDESFPEGLRLGPKVIADYIDRNGTRGLPRHTGDATRDSQADTEIDE